MKAVLACNLFSIKYKCHVCLQRCVCRFVRYSGIPANSMVSFSSCPPPTMLSGYTHCELRTCNMLHCTQQHIPSLPYHRQIACTLIYESQCLVPPVMYWFDGMHFHDIEFFFNQKRERHGLVTPPPPWGRGIPRVPYVFIDHSSGDGRERWRIEGCCPAGHPVFWCQRTELEWVGLK